jgi:hypothetical protein
VSGSTEAGFRAESTGRIGRATIHRAIWVGDRTFLSEENPDQLEWGVTGSIVGAAAYCSFKTAAASETHATNGLQRGYHSSAIEHPWKEPG